MSKFRYSLGIIALAAVCWPLASAHAGLVLNDPVVWTNSPSLEGWTNATPIGDNIAILDVPASGGADGAGDGFLSVTFTNTVNIIPQARDDVIYIAQSTNGESFSGLGNVAFSFLVSNVEPVSVYLTWHSTNMASTDSWQYAFSPTQTNVWESFVVPFGEGSLSDWNSSGGTDFLEDLAYVDWIGINISRLDAAFQDVYGIDNWEYLSSTIPEPGSLCLIAAALLAVAGARRKYGGGESLTADGETGARAPPG